MKTILITCNECGDSFERRTADYNRSKKLGNPTFCSRSCSASHKNKSWSADERRKYCYQIKDHAGNRKDQYSSFRYFVSKSRNCSRREKYGIPTISLEYLSRIWKSQNGICPYTGIKMVLPTTTKEHMSIHSLKKASLDRIDSLKGYVEGNVEFVCAAINMAKNSFTRKEMKEFLREIVVEPGEVESPS